MTNNKAIYWQRNTDEQQRATISPAPAADIDITKNKAIFLFPGAFVTDKANASAGEPEPLIKAGLGIVERVAGSDLIQKEGVKLYAASWQSGQAIVSQTKALNSRHSRYVSPEAKIFVEKVLAKGFTEDGITTRIQGNIGGDTLKPNYVYTAQKLPIDQVEKNFNNVTLVAHSVGNAFVQMVNNHLTDVMKGLGFSKDERQQASKALVSIGLANTARINTNERITSLVVTATNDGRSAERLSKFASNTHAKETKLTTAGNIAFVTGNVPTRVNFQLEGDKEPRLVEDHNAHHMSLYVSHPEHQENKIATYVRNTLRNAVERTETISSTTELLKSNKPLTHKTFNTTERAR